MNKQYGSILLSHWVDNIGLTLIGLVSLGYYLFADSFAELGIKFTFLDFPVFIGEISLFLCLLLLLIKWRIFRKKLKLLSCLALVYALFIAVKALTGYFKWGPLALRHAALFYYPFFAASGYFLFNKNYFSSRKTFFLILVFISIIIAGPNFPNSIQFDRLAIFVLSFILIKQQSNKKIRYFLFSLLFIFTPYRLFFWGQRTLLVSNIVSFAFILFTMFFVLKINKKRLLIVYVIILLFLHLGIKVFSDANSVCSITDLKSNMLKYQEYKEKLSISESSFTMQPIAQLHFFNKSEVLSSRAKNINVDRVKSQTEIEQRLLQLEKQRTGVEQKITELESGVGLGKAVQKDQPRRDIEEYPSATVTKRTEPLPMMKIEAADVIKFFVKPTKKVVEKEIKDIPPAVAAIPKMEPLPVNKTEVAYADKVLAGSPAKQTVGKQVNPEEEINLKETKPRSEAPVPKQEVTVLSDRRKELVLQQDALRLQLEKLKKEDSSDQSIPRDLNTVYNNSFFRIFIWQDMFADLIKEKPIFGFDFGKPFRSKKIEILNIAGGEWSRDGWIAAHNSYLEIIYRSGFIGILLILSIFSVFIRMAWIAVFNKSIIGVLLCAVLLNWLMAANFMLILELPYYAIPFWSLLGMSLAQITRREADAFKK
ncbi:MAG: O-antigen ligase family protein [Candidatus Omnitrophota bacterium]